MYTLNMQLNCVHIIYVQKSIAYLKYTYISSVECLLYELEYFSTDPSTRFIQSRPTTHGHAQTLSVRRYDTDRSPTVLLTET
jgi:hypothetical protein